MLEKKFQIISKESRVESVLENKVIVIDNGKFRVVLNSGRLNNLLESKGIAPEKRQQAWEAILKFKDEVDKSDKTKEHIGSTIPSMAISSTLFETLGESLFSDDEIEALFSSSQK
ncbi:MAG: hypothetical protein ACD_7C00196G0005 [uncultured bacterium]|nr:MAG: hypothetical protein ACD_7C00196G0005 [uncultured bacterium]